LTPIDYKKISLGYATFFHKSTLIKAKSMPKEKSNSLMRPLKDDKKFFRSLYNLQNIYKRRRFFLLNGKVVLLGGINQLSLSLQVLFIFSDTHIKYYSIYASFILLFCLCRFNAASFSAARRRDCLVPRIKV